MYSTSCKFPRPRSLIGSKRSHSESRPSVSLQKNRSLLGNSTISPPPNFKTLRSFRFPTSGSTTLALRGARGYSSPEPELLGLLQPSLVYTELQLFIALGYPSILDGFRKTPVMAQSRANEGSRNFASSVPNSFSSFAMAPRSLKLFRNERIDVLGRLSSRPCYRHCVVSTGDTTA